MTGPYVARLTRWMGKSVNGWAVMLGPRSKMSTIVATREEAEAILAKIERGPHPWVYE